MSRTGHVRFEFHPGWSAEARVIIDEQSIPIHIVRPVLTPQNINQPLMFAEWNWTWMDGNRYQFRCRVPDLPTIPAMRGQLRVNGETVAEGWFRGPLFVKLTQQWSWRMGPTQIKTRHRIGCRPRSSLRDRDGRCLAMWYPCGSRIRGVICGQCDDPQTPLRWGMILSTLVKPGMPSWKSAIPRT